MPIDLRPTQNNSFSNDSRDSRLDRYYQQHPQVQPEEEYQTEEQQPPRNVGKILHQWHAPEFESYEKSNRWYLIFALLIASLVVYALITNSPIMAITFILLGIVGYIHLEKDPRVITFAVTSEGILADKELYLYENINSFWIFYDPPHTKTLSIHTKASMLPYIHIPINDEDPVRLRELIIENVPEIKQDPSFIDTIERVFHI